METSSGVIDGFKTMWKGAMDYMWTVAKGPLNLVIGGINALIKGLNKIQIKIPDWSPVNPGASFGFNIPTIPKLAKGGIIAQPTQAIIGESRNRGCYAFRKQFRMVRYSSR